MYRILLPMMFVSPGTSIACYMISDMVSALYLALSFQASHVTGVVDWPLPDKDGKINRDWAELQIATTLDYATDSWFWTFFTGALNHQTVHHVFPGVSQYYYPEITPIMVQTCKDFNIKYNYSPSFTQALGEHIKHLYVLGREPKEADKTQ